MGILNKIKNVFFEDKKKTEIEEKLEENPEKFASASTENTIICNFCGEIIEGTPKFFKQGDRRLIFHRKCFKKLKHGQLPQ